MIFFRAPAHTHSLRRSVWQRLTNLKVELSGTVSLADWLITMKANAERSPAATQKS